MPFEEWLKNNIARSAAAPLYDTRWESRFAVFYWLLWKDHCSAVLNSDYSPKDDILFRDNRLVDECIQDLVIRHVPWDGNALEDRLSKWGRLHSQEAMTLAQPPSSLCALVSMDKESGLRDSLLPQDWLSNANAACFNLRTDPGR
ncbi:hypothetical protein V6N13_028931 [Hibiscus sabdariffa]